MTTGNENTGAASGLTTAAGYQWRDFDWGECGNCGGHNCETLTCVDPPYHADGDAIRCKSCGELGQIMCDPETPADDFWNGRDGMTVSISDTEA
jgi:hypothetical protein